MRLAYDTRWLPKNGNRPAEYEDAFAPSRARLAYGPPARRFAVADGASESLLAGLWAKVLVEAYCDLNGDADPGSVFASALRLWPAVLDGYMAERARRGEPVQWFEERGLERGAFATFLGLRLVGDTYPRTWSAIAVGDSCLLQFRGEQLVAAFPREPGDAFDNQPALVCSRTADPRALGPRVEAREGTFEAGDVFALVTDAVAAWFLDCEAAGDGDRARRLLDAPTQSAFDRAIGEARGNGSMRNDDVTVMRITVEE
jgi:hypothetical protein